MAVTQGRFGALSQDDDLYDAEVNEQSAAGSGGSEPAPSKKKLPTQAFRHRRRRPKSPEAQAAGKEDQQVLDLTGEAIDGQADVEHQGEHKYEHDAHAGTPPHEAKEVVDPRRGANVGRASVPEGKEAGDAELIQPSSPSQTPDDMLSQEDSEGQAEFESEGEQEWSLTKARRAERALRRQKRAPSTPPPPSSAPPTARTPVNTDIDLTPDKANEQPRKAPQDPKSAKKIGQAPTGQISVTDMWSRASRGLKKRITRAISQSPAKAKQGRERSRSRGGSPRGKVSSTKPKPPRGRSGASQQ